MIRFFITAPGIETFVDGPSARSIRRSSPGAWLAQRHAFVGPIGGHYLVWKATNPLVSGGIP